EPQGPGFNVPTKARERFAGLGRDADVHPIGADDDPVGAVQAIDAVDRILLHLDEGERPGGGVPVEDRERVVDLTGGVDGPAVRAHGHSTRPVEAGAAPAAVALDLEE